MKKAALRVVLAIVGVVFLMFILTYGSLFVVDFFVCHPYENDTWQTIDFFDKGSIKAPPDWTYTLAENTITLFDSNGEAIIYISSDEDYAAPGYVNEKDREFIERRNNIMGTGMYRASSEIRVYSNKNTGEKYYYAEIFKRDTFTLIKATHSFGYFFAESKDISIEEFTNVVTSYKK